jgi:hypothetical protein
MDKDGSLDGRKRTKIIKTAKRGKSQKKTKVVLYSIL